MKGALLLRTRVARRVVGLFFLCAVIPIFASAVYSYIHVSRQLSMQSRERLQDAVRATDSGILERLGLISAQLSAVSLALETQTSASTSDAWLQSELTGRMGGLAVTLWDGTPVTDLLGDFGAAPAAGEIDNPGRESRRPLLSVRTGPEGRAEIFLGLPLELDRVLWADIDADFLIGGGEEHPGIPTDMEVCVLGLDRAPIFCLPPIARRVSELLAVEGPPRGEIEWSEAGLSYLSTYRAVFLRASYRTPPGSEEWILLLSEPIDVVFGPMQDFKKIFPFAMLLAALVAVWLSNIQIRRSMDPLVELSQGTERIAARDFSTAVRVSSGDEFEGLADSFNSMADNLEKQFGAMLAINEIDRAVLSALDSERIIDTVISEARHVLEYDGVSVSLVVGTARDASWKLIGVNTSSGDKVVQNIRISDEERRELQDNPIALITDSNKGPRSYLDIGVFVDGGIGHFLVLPIFLTEGLSGAVALGYREAPKYAEDDFLRARQMVDQVAVALSNSRLVEELEDLKRGALTTLARTIDAKSPWTAGHSERVARMSVAVARDIGLSAEEIEVLDRGGLLHDIGKIGIPAAVLDKPGRLTGEEMAIMQTHVTLGARILEPIAAYEDVLPIVLRHHEKLDGTGYPDGLVGDDIDYMARLLAVADVFDALTSARPYRGARGPSDALAIIKEGIGSQFDPQFAEPFIKIISEGTVDLDEHTAAAVGGDAAGFLPEPPSVKHQAT